MTQKVIKTHRRIVGEEETITFYTKDESYQAVIWDDRVRLKSFIIKDGNYFGSTTYMTVPEFNAFYKKKTSKLGRILDL